jgi:hypothetical protein
VSALEAENRALARRLEQAVKSLEAAATHALAGNVVEAAGT